MAEKFAVYKPENHRCRCLNINKHNEILALENVQKFALRICSGAVTMSHFLICSACQAYPIGEKPWSCVCCSISLQADLYTLPAQSYSNTLLMPIAIKHYPTCGPSSPLQPVQRLVHAISNWELECSPLWSKWHEFYTLFQAHLQHYYYYSFVSFAVHIYQRPRIDCPFLFIFLHG